jgi:hypothetical protein
MTWKEKLNNILYGSIIGGILGALGGTDNSSKIFRRFSLPLFLSGTAWQHLHHWCAFSILGMIPILHIGYGIPDQTDKGSLLGRFFMRLFHNNILLANIFTRGLIGCLIGSTLTPIMIYKHNYILYIIGLYLIKSIFAFVSWQSIGGFEFNGKKLIWSEFIPYFIVSIVTLALIYF